MRNDSRTPSRCDEKSFFLKKVWKFLFFLIFFDIFQRSLPYFLTWANCVLKQPTATYIARRNQSFQECSGRLRTLKQKEFLLVSNKLFRFASNSCYTTNLLSFSSCFYRKGWTRLLMLPLLVGKCELLLPNKTSKITKSQPNTK